MQPPSPVEGRLIAWVAAALAAGPVYAVLVFGPALIGANAAMAWSLLLVIPLAVAMGLWLAALPIGVAVWVGGWLGARSPVWRHPLAWGAVGAVAGVGAAIGLDVTRLGGWMNGMVAGAAVGAIARRFMRWRDPVAL